MSAGLPERPVPRFDMTLRRGEARLRTRAAVPLPLGSLDALELVAGELGGPLDLRAGALALRDRRTHAVAASLSLSVRALEQALRALGLPVGLHAGALPATGAFGATLWLEDGPVDCEVRGVLDAGVLALRLERFASTLPREGLAASCGAALRPLEWTLAARGTPLHVSVDEHEQRLTLTIDHALEALLAGGLLAAGWRVPRTRGLAGSLRWCDGGERHGTTLTLLAQEALPEGAAPSAERAVGPTEAGGSDGVRPHEQARHRLAEVLDQALSAPIDVGRAKRLFDTYAALDPSPLMRADAALTLAELLCVCELAGDVTDVD
ncbi:MAG: hypothetical protein KBB95_13285, partial [Deltaproteobacteria bacterium]|nr:hypothetical protein [Deltaproteobacteria bacterium]